MSTILFDRVIFGPVHSRRLGLSLGVNLLPTDNKLCNFDCIYCECGWGKHGFKPRFNTREEGRTLLKELLASDNPAGMAMRLQRFSVSVPVWKIDEYKKTGAVEELEPFLILRDDGCRSFYREDVGLVAVGEEVLELLSC